MFYDASLKVILNNNFTNEKVDHPTIIISSSFTNNTQTYDYQKYRQGKPENYLLRKLCINTIYFSKNITLKILLTIHRQTHSSKQQIINE